MVGNASIARSNRNGQMFFVNHRYVKDKTLSSAIDQAYRDVLPSGKYGFAILNLEIDPAKVDCNVHPAKLEVRFEEEQKVFKAVYHAIKSKNEMIMTKSSTTPEIANQEQIQEKQEEPIEEKIEKTVEEPKKDEFKPRAGTFSGFFKKFLNEKEEEEENSIIKDIFEARKKGGSNWDNFDVQTTEKEVVEKTSKEIQEIEMQEEKLEESIEKTNLKIENELEALKEKTDSVLNETKIELEKAEPKVQEVKLGNTIISSDTRESDYNLNDILKQAAKENTMKIDTTKMFSSNDSKTEVIDSLKKMEEETHRQTVVIHTEQIRNEESSQEEPEEAAIVVEEPKKEEMPVSTVTERLLEQKVKNDMEDTQLIDTGKVRSELYNNIPDEIPMTKDFANMYKKVFGMDVSTVRKTKEEENAKLDVSNNIQIAENIENQAIFEENKEEKPTIKYRFIGTIFDSYAIIEVKDEMYMIEKNAAEERLMYEVVKKNFYNEENKDSVALLLADIVTLSPKEMSMARDLLEMFRKAGFDYDEFGESTLKLTQVPSWAEQLNTKKLFLEILREMDTVAVTATKEKEEKFISTVSSKYVMLSDTRLSENELEDLIKKLLTLNSPFMYPNGRLTAVKITRANMEKKFSRR